MINTKNLFEYQKNWLDKYSGRVDHHYLLMYSRFYGNFNKIEIYERSLGDEKNRKLEQNS